MSKVGYIKFYRKSLDNPLFKTKEPLTHREAWENILLTVNYKDEKVNIGKKEFLCKKGQSLKSIRTWAEEFNWSTKKTFGFLNKLKDLDMIKVESLGFTSRLTVVNYQKYQSSEVTEEVTDKVTEEVKDKVTEEVTDETQLKDSKSNQYNDNEINGKQERKQERKQSGKQERKQLRYPNKEYKEYKEVKEEKNINTTRRFPKNEFSEQSDNFKNSEKSNSLDTLETKKEKEKKVARKKEKDILIADIVSGKVEYPAKTKENRYKNFAITLWKLLEPHHKERIFFKTASLEKWAHDSKVLARKGLDLYKVHEIVEWALLFDPSSIPFMQSPNYLITKNFKNISILESKKELFDQGKGSKEAQMLREEKLRENVRQSRKKFRKEDYLEI